MAAIRILAAAAAVILAGCASFQREKEPLLADGEVATSSGFAFRWPPGRHWDFDLNAPGLYRAHRVEPAPGSSEILVVRHGPIHTPGGRAMTPRELLDRFQSDLEREPAGRVTGVKRTFTRRAFRGAECLSFETRGRDQGAPGAPAISNDGLICLHPRRPYQFVWLAVSERAARLSVDLADDERTFFESLRVLD